MQQALQAADTCGRCLIHVSSVNTGARTYDGIDMCGTRLAAEITQLAAAHPSLCSISLLGHSMGGLIARYALGLLADPKTRKVAGLNPSHFISIATPHLGCCSDHPEEVAWQDRPWMHWLSAAVRAGHLGGAVAAAPAAAAAAATPVAGDTGNADDSKTSSSSSSGSSSSSKHRATYSSAGGDHLIPWASSSLLFPRQLPSWPGQLPAPALWARQPAIVQWPQPAAAAAAGGEAVAEQESVGPWSHFHVVWPRLCLGSSHCNIQYNGPLNFVGRAVVAHVVASLVTAADRQPIGWGEGVRGARAGLRALVDPEVPCTIAAECVEGKE
ncbi:hypothetical protein OEZ85_009970 [Tetradesmus obliquus]|uniref:DUF676 domain-containing protein n=1 Tax=Tetradesmus obliquus TaxID=3088 RepID=A0ABY8UAV6_TETOB|nr:hypothetical protein OEZ85_009970 [Tetradesmus obliquus]